MPMHDCGRCFIPYPDDFHGVGRNSETFVHNEIPINEFVQTGREIKLHNYKTGRTATKAVHSVVADSEKLWEIDSVDGEVHSHCSRTAAVRIHRGVGQSATGGWC